MNSWASWTFMVEYLNGRWRPLSQNHAHQMVEHGLLYGYNITKSDDQIHRA